MESLVITWCFPGKHTLGVCAKICALIHLLMSVAILSVATITFWSLNLWSLNLYPEQLHTFLSYALSREVDYNDANRPKFAAFLLSFVMYFLISLALNCIHAYAVFKGKRKLFLPWLIFNGTSIVAISFIVISVSMVYRKVLVIMYLMPVLICSYLVSHSYYFELKTIEVELGRIIDIVIESQHKIKNNQEQEN